MLAKTQIKSTTQTSAASLLVYQEPQDPIGLAGGMNLYQYTPNALGWVDPLGLTGNPATATHITYIGLDQATGKPYIGYASMQGNQTPEAVLKYRYGNNFSRFGGQVPDVAYSGYGIDAKHTARGLEQRIFEYKGGLKGTANMQNPVGKNNSNRSSYLSKADDHLGKNSKSNKGGGCL